ncbi:DUF4198 domain-containing protein [Dethiosulfatarculus sandiegensis]|uniref:Nickel transporter n=1 Tax=Dethiosulfatarculus sandiegensis TaxID=1429043 RepID=A0A0D2GDF8_9BACT|nr:DUF4198 domain-containing protein [Dethiosulfatarculus sandiegensis]KIX12982.1 hypothetical protein X474_16115 [Dethiosulfatarculus sandiegensis]
MKLKIWLAALALVLCAVPALAHNLWLVPMDYNPEVGQELKVMIGFGHSYPASRIDEQVKEGMLQEVSAVGPDGKVFPLVKKDEGLYTLTPKAPGAYLVRTLMKPGFFCRTKKGFKRGNKKQVQNVTSCMHFQMIANAPILVGSAAKAQTPPKDQELQLLPLVDISGLKSGDSLPVQVLFKGAPLAGAKLTATYAGYQPPKDLPKAKIDPKLSPKEKARLKMKHKMASSYPVRLKTDAKGKAEIKLSAPGWWLVILNHSTPYEDLKVCDTNLFKTTYTFEVR